MFFKIRRLSHSSLNFYKLYITRLSLAIKWRFYHDQLFIIRLRNRRSLFFAASLVGGFSFRTVGTLDEEYEKVDSESDSRYEPFAVPETDEGWEQVWCDKCTRVFRRKLKGCESIYEYRCIGTYHDITPNDFVMAQKDVDYRRQWDKNVKSLEVLEEDWSTGTQVVRWESKYPYPLQPRLYIFLRREFVDRQNKQITVICKALDEHIYPDQSKASSVRVTQYASTMIVRAHSKFDECGLDFLLQYYDDTKAPIPRKIYEFGVNVVGPNFLADVHNAALKLLTERESRNERIRSEE